ncbi:MAG TPA: ATP-binding protein [Candidatus Bathyarchaeia archaeon]|nr:ATP-binding protein [Candidatus Bathyarchaeia archaeon]
MVNELPAEKLRRECDASFMRCETTQELVPLREIIGQERAVRALKFGIGIREHGFNIYVAGFPGTGRTTAVKNFVEEIARVEPVPPDWCYVNNFSNPYDPKAIKLPLGKGKEFRDDVKNLIENIRTALPKAFESEDYTTKQEATIRGLESQRKELIEQLNAKAQQEGFIIQSTPIGLLLIPVIKGKPVSEEELLTLPQEAKDAIQEKRERLESGLRSTMRQFLDMEQKIHEELKKLNREVALYAIGHLMEDLIEKYKGTPEVTAYLRDVQNDVLDNLSQFIKRGEPQQQLPFPVPWMREDPFKKYEVNVIVDNSNIKGAPVVTEFNPTYQNLFGRTEKEAQFGALITDFTMIRGGALHRANYGYLIVRVEELLRNPFSYDGLKRALRDGRIVIEEPEERYGFISTKSLKPQPIPLSVKVILIGDPYLYQQLFILDMEFSELFKVKAEFDTTMARTEENVQQYAAFVCTLCQKENLKHLDGSGLAKLVEYSSRLAADQQKLSTRFAEIADIIREANFYATQENSSLVTGNHVKKAIEEKIYRSKLIQEKIQEMIKRGILLIDTEAENVGQVNGLSVMSLGDFAFGSPSRVTASVGLGREGIIDIERKAKMGGPIHTKGVLILSGYLNEKYARDKPLSLSARLVFEQNYEGVEGDSASSTELYAILSALSGLPIKQNIAVTGSVNQKGEVQAIGGVNEKIEGFFEVCKAKGLTGKQGVMIPESNVQNLMLKEEIVDAVKQGKFHIYSVKTIDEGIEVLTGVKTGERREDGTFENGTVNHKVDKRLKNMAEKLREFQAFPSEGKTKTES